MFICLLLYFVFYCFLIYLFIFIIFYFFSIHSLIHSFIRNGDTFVDTAKGTIKCSLFKLSVLKRGGNFQTKNTLFIFYIICENNYFTDIIIYTIKFSLQ